MDEEELRDRADEAFNAEIKVRGIDDDWFYGYIAGWRACETYSKEQ